MYLLICTSVNIYIHIYQYTYTFIPAPAPAAPAAPAAADGRLLRDHGRLCGCVLDRYFTTVLEAMWVLGNSARESQEVCDGRGARCGPGPSHSRAL